MSPFLFVPYYFCWHYGKAPRQIIRLSANFLWFTWNFFSIGLLLRTLFSPWMRMHDTVPAKNMLDIEGKLSTLIINMVIRGFGAFTRGVIIIAGIISLIAVIIASVVIFCAWLVAPVVVVILLLMGCMLIIQGI